MIDVPRYHGFMTFIFLRLMLSQMSRVMLDILNVWIFLQGVLSTTLFGFLIWRCNPAFRHLCFFFAHLQLRTIHSIHHQDP